MKRRSFLKNILSRLLKISAAVILVYPIISYLFYRKTRIRRVTFRLSECPGEISFKKEVYLIKKGNDLYALSAHCSHLGCIINFDQKTEKFHCPCHGSIFDIHGNRLAGPARRPLSRIPIEFDKDGNVLVKVRRTA